MPTSAVLPKHCAVASDLPSCHDGSVVYVYAHIACRWCVWGVCCLGRFVCRARQLTPIISASHDNINPYLMVRIFQRPHGRRTFSIVIQSALRKQSECFICSSFCSALILCHMLQEKLGQRRRRHRLAVDERGFQGVLQIHRGRNQGRRRAVNQQDEMQHRPRPSGPNQRSHASNVHRRGVITAAVAAAATALCIANNAGSCSASIVLPVHERTQIRAGVPADTGRTRGLAAVVHAGEGNGRAQHVPRVPFCRAGADVANMWLPVWDADSQVMQSEKRVVVFGGRGVDYYSRQVGDQLSYLQDMWALHITNTGFRWNKVLPHGTHIPSPRWQSGSSVVSDTRLVVYGGDDQTTNEIGGLGDLWVYSPKTSRPHAGRAGASMMDEWKEFSRGGEHPGERRDPSLTMINSTLLLQGGKVVDGQSNEQCDSRLFLLDLADPKGEWRQGASLPGDCGLGQTMDTITLKMGEKETVRAVVFGGCQPDESGVFACSNDLYAYDLQEDKWDTIKPKSDADASACASSMVIKSFEDSGPSGNSTTNSTFGGSGSGSGSSSSAGSSTESHSKPAKCPGRATPRPLGRHFHASAYIESKADDVHSLFVFGGRENTDRLAPLGDLWTFDFKKMRWAEVVSPPKKKVPSNRFSHSLTVWEGGAGDGVASLVVFGGETITRTGQTSYLNDVWLYTPHTGAWREVSHSECQEGANGIVRGGDWTALLALVSLLALVVVVQCLLHNICPHYEPPLRRRRRRRRTATEDGRSMPGSKKNGDGKEGEDGSGRRPKSLSAISTGLLASDGDQKRSYQAVEA